MRSLWDIEHAGLGIDYIEVQIFIDTGDGLIGDLGIAEFVSAAIRGEIRDGL